MSKNLKFADKLLSDITNQLLMEKEVDHLPITRIGVIFLKDNKTLWQGDLITALDIISNDLHLEGGKDCGEANKAEVFELKVERMSCVEVRKKYGF